MKVSIITATWNSEGTLKSCLDSVAQQSAVSSIEHIIIDGRSNDSTLVIASQYSHVSHIVSARIEVSITHSIVVLSFLQEILSIF
ncbi:glycosyltransferase [Aeromonas hydrophila]